MMLNKLRWLPAIAIPALIAAGVVSAQASSAAVLPQRSPAQVIAMAAEHPDTSFSGMVKQVSDLGLPQLPTTGPDASSGASAALEWLSGSHTARIFVDGPSKARVQVMDQFGERDVVVNGSQAWFYNSRQKTALHATVPAAERMSGVPGMGSSPVALAERLLTKLDGSTKVTLGSNVNVAGRAAYELVLKPKTENTLVGSVLVAVDGTTGIPLSVSVVARGQDNPAVSVAFTELSLETPAASLFSFTPPAGTAVTEHSVTKHSEATKPAPSAPGAMRAHDPIISGSDWSTVVAFSGSSAPAKLLSSPLFTRLTTAVPEGRLLSTSLLNVLITNNGRVVAGAVPLPQLQAAVAGQ